MAGLLNGGGFDDPLTMGLLGASQALMTPMSQGGGMGAAFNAFPAAQQQAMRQQFLRQQMEGQQSEAELRRAQLMAAQEKARRDAEQLAARQGILGGIAAPQQMGFRDANIAITGVAPAGYQPLEQRNPITQDVVAQWVAAGGDPDVLKKLAESGDWGRAEVARVLDTADSQGRPQQQQMDRFGRSVGSVFAKPYEKKMVNTGGAQVGYDPYTLGLTGQSIANTMTPGEIESNRVALGNLGVSRARLAMDQQNAGVNNGQVLPDQGLIVDKKTGRTIPIMVGGAPMVPAGKKPTEDENKSAGYAIRMEDALRTMKAVTDEKPSAATPNAFAKGVGMVNADVGNLFTSEARQRVEAAQLDALDAALTLATGAAYTKEQLAGLSKSYFPQLNDQPKTIADKQARFNKVIETARIRAGAAAGNIDLISNRPAGLGSGQVSGQVGVGRPPLSSFGAP